MRAHASEREPGTAQKAVVELLSKALAAQERGEIDTSSLAPDAFTWGTGPGDAFISREALARSTPGAKFTAGNLERHVFVAPDGKSAWFWEMYGRSGRLVRHTGLAARSAGKWAILAQHVSYAYGEDTDERDRQGKLPPLAAVGDGVAPGAEDIATLLRSAVFFDRMLAAATPSDFILIGTDPDYLAGSVVRPLPGGVANGPRPQDGVRAGVSPSGQTGWAAANVIWIKSGTRTMGPMRFLFVFAKDSGRWRLVQNHHSYAPE